MKMTAGELIAALQEHCKPDTPVSLAVMVAPEGEPDDTPHPQLEGTSRMGLNFGAGHAMLVAALPPDGALAILAERRRQTAEEGWTADHDDSHVKSELTGAAMAYLIHTQAQALSDADAPLPMVSATLMAAKLCWPWRDEDFKPGVRQRNLEKAGALLAAEHDRLTRVANGTTHVPSPEENFHDEDGWG